MTAKDRLDQRRTLLDEYEKGLGLPTNNPPGEENELQEYLNMTRNQVEALDAGTAIGIAVRLSQFAFYFQRAINREKANKTWAESELSMTICKEILQYDRFTPNKAELVCKENAAANELRRIALYAQQRIERLEELSAGLRNLSYVIGLVAKNRMGESR